MTKSTNDAPKKNPLKNRRALLGAGLLGVSGAAVLGAQSRDAWSPKKTAATLKPGDTPKKGARLTDCIRSGHLLFVSGIGGWYPARRKEAGDAEVQMRSALTTMKEILERAGSSMDNVLKVNIGLVDPEKNFDPMNLGYAGFFSDPAPARSFIGMTSLQTKGSLMIVDCIAYVD
jgi:2-iminobutanoate/2-iminopropanoate deaminase